MANACTSRVQRAIAGLVGAGSPGFVTKLKMGGSASNVPAVSSVSADTGAPSLPVSIAAVIAGLTPTYWNTKVRMMGAVPAVVSVVSTSPSLLNKSTGSGTAAKAAAMAAVVAEPTGSKSYRRVAVVKLTAYASSSASSPTSTPSSSALAISS